MDGCSRQAPKLGWRGGGVVLDATEKPAEVATISIGQNCLKCRISAFNKVQYGRRLSVNKDVEIVQGLHIITCHGKVCNRGAGECRSTEHGCCHADGHQF